MGRGGKKRKKISYQILSLFSPDLVWAIRISSIEINFKFALFLKLKKLL
jgi:hypothetical protein